MTKFQIAQEIVNRSNTDSSNKTSAINALERHNKRNLEMALNYLNTGKYSADYIVKCGIKGIHIF